MDTIEGEVVAEAPAGDFKVELDGKTIWFNNLSNQQGVMFRRLASISQRKINELMEAAESEQDEDVKVSLLQDAALESSKLHERMWDMVESSLADPDDMEHIIRGVIARRLDEQDAMRVFRRGKDPELDDDQDVPPRTSRKTSATGKTAAGSALRAAKNASRKRA